MVMMTRIMVFRHCNKYAQVERSSVTTTSYQKNYYKTSIQPEDATNALKLYVCGKGLNLKPSGCKSTTLIPLRDIVPCIPSPGESPTDSFVKPAETENAWELSVTLLGAVVITTAHRVSEHWVETDKRLRKGGQVGTHKLGIGWLPNWVRSSGVCGMSASPHN
jgi:hypothetical protein